MTTRETKNYVWDISLSCVLGRGQMGTVYKGSCKTTGEKVAIKALNRGTPKEYQLRELAQLSAIHHENILKLLAVEEEQVEGKTVIILELCTGGSLHSYLQEPENHYGLEEDEVLLVLEHLEKGVKYLRENNILHRDLKPGNIIRHVGEDGRNVYKLSDFDAARNLPEGEEFESIFGTPAYLCPSLYEQQFMAAYQVPQRKFSECTDLWSIGVTLYHVATGRLPFMPFEGTENFKTMHQILTKKPSGFISGTQSKMGGPIEYKDCLPDDCLLSQGLQKSFTPLLATLLESDTKKRCSFAEFFSLAEDIVSRRKVHIFYVNEVKAIRVYLDGGTEDKLQDLQAHLREQTHIASENQMLFFKDSTLKLLVEQNNGSLLFCKTNQENPILLCHREDNNIEAKWRLPTGRFLVFPNQLNFHADAKLAKHNVEIGHVYRRQLETINRSIALFNSTALTINQVVVSQLIGVSKEVLQIKSVINSLGLQFKMMEAFHKSCRSFIPLIPKKSYSESVNATGCLTSIVNSMGESFTAQKIAFQALKDRLQELSPALHQLLNNRVENRSLIHEWETMTQKIPESEPVMITATNILHNLRSSLDNLNPEPYSPGHSRRQSHENQLFHLTERLLMQDKCKSLHGLLKKQYNDVFHVVVKLFSDWYKTAQVATIQPEILTQDLAKLRRTLSECEIQLNSSVDDFHVQLNTFTDGLRKSYAETELEAAMKEKRTKSRDKEGIKLLNAKLRELIVSQQELKKTFLIDSCDCAFDTK